MFFFGLRIPLSLKRCYLLEIRSAFTASRNSLSPSPSSRSRTTHRTVPCVSFFTEVLPAQARQGCCVLRVRWILGTCFRITLRKLLLTTDEKISFHRWSAAFAYFRRFNAARRMAGASAGVFSAATAFSMGQMSVSVRLRIALTRVP